MVISWAEPDANGEAITAYEILIKQADGLFTEETTHCQGSQELIVTNRSCSVPFTTLRDPPYSLEFGELVQVKVRAFNSIGASEENQENTSGATIQVEPGQITTLAIDNDISSNESIGLVWQALTGSIKTGGAPINNYKIRWNQGSLVNTWVDKEVVAADSSETYSVTIGGLTGGVYYQFTILAENIHGWGTQSAVFTENAAGKPNKPEAVVTINYGTSIKVDWSTPGNNYKTITAYRVLIKDQDSGEFSEHATLCNGSSTEVVANTLCTIPVSSLRSELGYELGDIPQFKVAAYNARGFSTNSDANTTGAVIKTEPSRMDPVVRNSATVENSIVIDWLPLSSPANGDSEVIAYNLQWYKESQGAWVDLYGVLPQQIDTQFTLTSEIEPGVSY